MDPTTTTAVIEQIRQPLSGLLIGFILSVAAVMPYYYGLTRAAVVGYNGQDDISPAKLLFMPILAVMIGIIAAQVLATVWDLFFPNRTTETLVRFFWEARPIETGTGANKWANAATTFTSSIALVMYYAIIAMPLVTLATVATAAGGMHVAMDTTAFKIYFVKFILVIGASSILIFFYFTAINAVVFRSGGGVDFYSYGSASSAQDMHVKFYKKIARAGILGLNAAITPSN